MKTAMDELDKSKSYKLECGHNNAGVINLYPFKTFVCLECGLKTERVIEVKE